MQCKDCKVEMNPVEIQNIDYYMCPKCRIIIQKPPKKEQDNKLIESIKQDPNDSIEWSWGK